MENIKKAEILEACARELAMNFECPAPQIMGVYAAKLGMTLKQLQAALMAR
jgi:hypothetical protein